MQKGIHEQFGEALEFFFDLYYVISFFNLNTFNIKLFKGEGKRKSWHHTSPSYEVNLIIIQLDDDYWIEIK